MRIGGATIEKRTEALPGQGYLSREEFMLLNPQRMAYFPPEDFKTLTSKLASSYNPKLAPAVPPPAYQTKVVYPQISANVSSSRYFLAQRPEAQKTGGIIEEINQAVGVPSEGKEGLNTNVNLKKFSIENFELIKNLGRGRFGDVFLAREKKTNFIVALKIISKKEASRLNGEKLIVREIKIQSFLDHKNIIKLYGFFHDDDKIYLILEYAPEGEVYKDLKNSVILSACWMFFRS